MQITLSELLGVFGIVASIVTGVWVLLDRFRHVESRVARLEVKVDEILTYLRRKKMTRHQKH